MRKPYKYTIICNKTKQVISERNNPPSQYELEGWERVEESNIFKIVQAKTCYVDTRYEAKLRLYNYIENKKRLLFQ